MQVEQLVVPVGTAVLAFGGVVAGHWVSWRSARQLDRWRPREETMRMLRWGVELCARPEARGGELGIVVLEGLLESDLVDRADRQFVADVFGFVADPTSP